MKQRHFRNMYLKGLWISIQKEIYYYYSHHCNKQKNLAKLQNLKYPCNLKGGHLIITAKNIGKLCGIFWKSQSVYNKNV